jgi:ribonuclease H-related protein
MKNKYFLAIVYKNGKKFLLTNNKTYVKENILLIKKFNLSINAKKWLLKINIINNINQIQTNKMIFCDSGTSNSNTTEIKALFKNKNILTYKYNLYLNREGNLTLNNSFSNNFGELLAIFFSLEYALRNNIKYICSDSLIVSVYWINNFFSDKINNITKILIKNTILYYKMFRKRKGKIFLIPSKYNKADVKK